jgi:hypothetical protein
MIQPQDPESQRQRAWSFNAALFVVIAYALSALVAFLLGDFPKAWAIGGGSTIIGLLISFKDYHNQPGQQTSFGGERSISELPESSATSQDQKDLCNEEGDRA